jgi:hypothetical protein
MDKPFYFIITIAFIIALSDGTYREHKQIMQQIDHCYQIHGSRTVEVRDYKPKYKRELKRVILTCESDDE